MLPTRDVDSELVCTLADNNDKSAGLYNMCGVARPRPPVRRLNGTLDGNESYSLPRHPEFKPFETVVSRR